MIKERLCYIDAAKGLLVILVLFYHLPVILNDSSHINCEYFKVIGDIAKLYTPFFMPAFFVITGYCTNFEKNKILFVMSIFKGLIIPMLTLNIIPCILSFNLNAFQQFLRLDFWLWGLSFWFVPCLILSKIIYYIIYQYSNENKLLFLLIILLLMAFGVVCDQEHLFQNYWYWKNSLVFLGCIHFGQFLKVKECDNNILLIGSITYIFLILLLNKNINSIPSLGLNIDYSLENLVLFVPLCLGGSCLILLFLKIIKTENLLTYIGKGSLIFYCCHWMIAQHIGKWIGIFFIPNNNSSAVLFVLLVMGFTIVFCVVFIYILNLRYIRFFIGK